MSQHQKSESPLYFPHKKKYLLEFSPMVSFCGNCSSAIIGNKKSTIKPLKYHTKWENVSFSFLPQSKINNIYSFYNYKDFSKIRAEFVKTIKKKCEKLGLELKTYFLSLDYFFQICSILTSFSKEDLKEIADICIILAAKTNEAKKKAIQVKLKLSGNTSSNRYLKDEQYILSKLNYDLIRITSYDILIDIMKCGFVFDDEVINPNKLNMVYNQMENMLYLFSETKHYIFMSPKEVAIGIMGFAREILGLAPFNESVQIVFMNIKDVDNIHNYNYLKCLNKIKKCFKIVENNNSNNNINNNNINNNNNNNNHSDSTKDSNSDN